MARLIDYQDLENIRVFDDIALDPAIVDVFESEDGLLAVYNYKLIMDILIDEGYKTIDEAKEIINGLLYDDGPIILFDV